MNKKSINKKNIISISIMVFCLLMLRFFPEKDYFQKFIISLTFLFLVPFLYIKIVLKEDLKNFGLQIGSWKKGIAWSIFSLMGAFLVLILLYQYADLADKYYLPQGLIDNFGLFVFYEAILVSFFLALYEFFFRGFMLFSFIKKGKFFSVILQFVAFLLFLIIAKDLNWSLTHYIIAAFFSGIVAYESRSLIYSYLFGWLFVIISDAIYIHSLIY